MYLLPKLFNNVFCVSCLGIWWRHDVLISEKLKFDYSKTKKKLWNEAKNIFASFASAHGGQSRIAYAVPTIFIFGRFVKDILAVTIFFVKKTLQ